MCNCKSKILDNEKVEFPNYFFFKWRNTNCGYIEEIENFEYSGLHVRRLKFEGYRLEQ